jgi:uncharacterized protein YqjF (DUF2071 family)
MDHGLELKFVLKKSTRVWFLSLDAASWLAVRAARCSGLPYYDARMAVELSAGSCLADRTDETDRARAVEMLSSFVAQAPGP